MDIRYVEPEIRFSRHYCAKASKQMYLFGNADELNISWPHWEWFFISLFILLFSTFNSFFENHIPNWILTGFSLCNQGDHSMTACCTSVAVIATQDFRHLNPAPIYTITWDAAVCGYKGWKLAKCCEHPSCILVRH